MLLHILLKTFLLYQQHHLSIRIPTVHCIMPIIMMKFIILIFILHLIRHIYFWRWAKMPLALFSMCMTSNPVLKLYLDNGSQCWSLLLYGLQPKFTSCLCRFSSPVESYWSFFLFPICLDYGINAEAFDVNIRGADLAIFFFFLTLWIHLLLSESLWSYPSENLLPVYLTTTNLELIHV